MRAGFGLGWEGFWVEAWGFWGGGLFWDDNVHMGRRFIVCVHMHVCMCVRVCVCV